MQWQFYLFSILPLQLIDFVTKLYLRVATNFHQFSTLSLQYVLCQSLLNEKILCCHFAQRLAYLFYILTWKLMDFLINILLGSQQTSINFPFWVSVLTICPKSVYKMKNNILSVCAVAILSFFYFDITTNSLFS